MKELVKLNKRPSHDGSSFTFVLRYIDEIGRRKWITLGHSDMKKAEKQRVQKEKELRMGYVEPGSVRLSEFLRDSFVRTGDQIRESTRLEYGFAMRDLIAVIGNVDFKCVQHTHGELFRQVRFDKGDRPATVAKKLRGLKRLFQLAVERRQLDENPFKYVKEPKVAKQKIRVYTTEEIDRIVKAASSVQNEAMLEWDLLITLGLTTGMRKSEMLNLVWSDIDFGEMQIAIGHKESTAETWAWKVKDTDRRTVPLKEDVSRLLVDLQGRRPEGHPYVFVTPQQYERIQQLRRKGKWTLWSAKDKVANNFTRQFDKILKLANVPEGTFHDIRKTAITNWFRQGLSAYDVMTLAGHANFATTHRFYLAVADNLVQRAREATTYQVSRDLLEKCCRNIADEKAHV